MVGHVASGLDPFGCTTTTSRAMTQLAVGRQSAPPPQGGEAYANLRSDETGPHLSKKDKRRPRLEP